MAKFVVNTSNDQVFPVSAPVALQGEQGLSGFSGKSGYSGYSGHVGLSGSIGPRGPGGGGGAGIERFMNPVGTPVTIGALTHLSFFMYPITLAGSMNIGTVRNMFSISAVASSLASSGAFTCMMGFYERNATNASQLTQRISISSNWNWGSNANSSTNWGGFSGGRIFDMTHTGLSIPQGDYIVGMFVSTGSDLPAISGFGCASLATSIYQSGQLTSLVSGSISNAKAGVLGPWVGVSATTVNSLVVTVGTNAGIIVGGNIGIIKQPWICLVAV